jgi:hypothetical protein
MSALEVEAFRAWLRECAEESVGVSGSSERCPLAVYLSEHEGQKCRVGAFCAEGEFSGRYDLPSWAQVFATRVDVVYKGGTSLSGAQALRLLDQACKWAE